VIASAEPRPLVRGTRLCILAALVTAATLTSCAKTRRPPGTPAEAAPPPAAPAAPPVLLDAAALPGDWARAVAAEGVQGLRLGDDGTLTIVGTAPTRGVSWKASEGSLVLSLENPGVGPWELAVPVRGASPSRLDLGGGNAAFAGAWRRATFTTVEGAVTYRQRTALTPEAVVFVDLRDAGSPPEVPPLARARVTEPGQVPVAFSLTYDPASLDPSRAYALSARISDRGELRFVTEKPVPLPTAGDAPPVEIVVGPVR
jgi:uncharacterized lipoprotein YbaY